MVPRRQPRNRLWNTSSDTRLETCHWPHHAAQARLLGGRRQATSRVHECDDSCDDHGDVGRDIQATTSKKRG
jgi:hypothetical protein